MGGILEKNVFLQVYAARMPVVQLGDENRWTSVVTLKLGTLNNHTQRLWSLDQFLYEGDTEPMGLPQSAGRQL